MNIVIIGPAYPFRGGIADTNESMFRALTRAGHSVSIVSFRMQYPAFLFPGKTQLSEDPSPEGMEIYSWIHSVNPLNWIRTARRINGMAPDLVIFRQWIPFMAPAFGTIARLLKSSITRLTLVDNLYPHEKRPFDRVLTNYLIKKNEAFVAFSKTVMDQLKDEGFDKVLYTPHPLVDNLGEETGRNEACEELGLDPDMKYVLFFGLVRKYKGLDLLLDAFAVERLRELDVKLIVAGEFYDDPENYTRIIKKHGLEDKVLLVNRFIPSAEIRYYFSAADIVAQTYHSATQSGITQVAYNFNRPMLVTNVGGLTEYVLHGRVGYVVEKDVKEIASSLVDFFENNRFGEYYEGVKQEKKRFGWDVFVSRLDEFYNSI